MRSDYRHAGLSLVCIHSFILPPSLFCLLCVLCASVVKFLLRCRAVNRDDHRCVLQVGLELQFALDVACLLELTLDCHRMNGRSTCRRLLALNALAGAFDAEDAE